MSGGKKTLKEWANIFGKPIVVDSDDTILVFSSVPRYEVGIAKKVNLLMIGLESYCTY